MIYKLLYVVRLTNYHILIRLNFNKVHSGFTNVTSVSTRAYSSDSEGDDQYQGDKNVQQIPEPPTNCCMAGCPNCVWIAYAEELSKIIKDSNAKTREIIKEKVQDPNMRAFLDMELKILERKMKEDKGDSDS